MLVDYHSCRVYLAEGDELVPIAVKGEEARGGGDADRPAHPDRPRHHRTGRRDRTLAPALERAATASSASSCPARSRSTSPSSPCRSATARASNGVVFLSQLGLGRFDENDVRLLEVLAGYAAVALENARLYESLRREAEHAKAWLEFADEVSAAGSLEGMIDTVVVTVARLLEADQCSLWLEDEAMRRLRVRRLVRLPGGADRRRRSRSTRVTGEAAEEFIRSRKTPFLMNAQELHDWFFSEHRDRCR